MTDAEPKPDQKEALRRDALLADQHLKRKYRECFQSDPKESRDIIRRVRARVFRMKPGPKPQRNPLIAKAARQRGRGVSWSILYPLYIDRYAEWNEHTRVMAEDGFRRRVTDYLRDHPRLKSPRGTPATENKPEPAQ